jgi:hypothetical protein
VISRRRFLEAMLAAAMAPAVGCASSLVPDDAGFYGIITDWGAGEDAPLLRGELGRWEGVRFINGVAPIGELGTITDINGTPRWAKSALGGFVYVGGPSLAVALLGGES